MKKLLKKRYFIPLLVVAVMAIAATTAYAWWTTTAQSDPQYRHRRRIRHWSSGANCHRREQTDPGGASRGRCQRDRPCRRLQGQLLLGQQHRPEQPILCIGCLDNVVDPTRPARSQVHVKILSRRRLAVATSPARLIQCNSRPWPVYTAQSPVSTGAKARRQHLLRRRMAHAVLEPDQDAGTRSLLAQRPDRNSSNGLQDDRQVNFRGPLGPLTIVRPHPRHWELVAGRTPVRPPADPPMEIATDETIDRQHSHRGSHTGSRGQHDRPRDRTRSAGRPSVASTPKRQPNAD